MAEESSGGTTLAAPTLATVLAPPVEPPPTEQRPHRPTFAMGIESPTIWDQLESDYPIEADYVPKSWPVWLVGKLYRFGEVLFGIFTVIVAMAVIATIPILNLVTLGYLLECSAGVARNGKLSEGFVDARRWSRIGEIVIGTYIMLIPLWFLADLARDADLISPGGVEPRLWRGGIFVLAVVLVGHTLLAWYSGGKMRHFFWPLLAPFQIGLWLVGGKVVGPLVRPLLAYLFPKLTDDLYAPAPLTSWFPPAILWAGIRRGPVAMYVEARDAVWDFVVGLRLAQLFWLGLRAFLGTAVWLAFPALFIVAGSRSDNDGIAVLTMLFGSILMATVLLYLPFLQIHFTLENRMGAMFEWFHVRRMFKRAPIAFWFSLLVTLALAIPLYLLKIEFPLREIAWVTTLVFMVFIYPARLLTGWAYGRARRREKPRFFLFRWMSRLAVVPVLLFYALIVYLSTYTSWYGAWAAFEQHVVLMPAPFMSW